jgi:hypothetical protein
MCMSRRRKDDLVTYRNHFQTPESFALLEALKPDKSPVCPVCPESVQHRNLTSKVCTYQTVCQNRLYV